MWKGDYWSKKTLLNTEDSSSSDSSFTKSDKSSVSEASYSNDSVESGEYNKTLTEKCKPSDNSSKSKKNNKKYLLISLIYLSIF